MPAVSIIVPVYNGAAHLQHVLSTLLRQTMTDFELVIIDDGSTDATAAIVGAFAAAHGNIVFISQANTGVAKARERAVAEASGDYLWFVDSDDEGRDDALERLYGAAVATRADVVVAGAEFVYASGERRPLPAPTGDPVSGRDAFRLLLTGGITGHLWNKLFSRAVMSSFEYVPARVHSDLAMVAGGLARAGKVSFIPESVYEYHIRSGSIITTRTSRAQSLVEVGEAVEAAALHVDPAVLRSDEYRYFRARYIVLSAIKDGVLGPYSREESNGIVRRLRRRLTAGELAVFARRRDARRLLLGVAAKTSVPAYRVLLRVAER